MRKVFIIAEAGINHNGDIKIAKKMASVAAESGADAVKFQAHIFGAESLPDAPNPSYFNKESRKEYFEKTAFTFSEWGTLKEYAEKECSVEFISSVFSLEALNWLEKIGVRRHKIPSGEVTNTPLLEKTAITKKPVLLSSGMSSWEELDKAVQTLQENGCSDLTVLQCTSLYPCPPEKTGLNVLKELKKRYRLSVGLSDHTLGLSTSVAAVVLGAKVIEKHFTLSRDMPGSDARHSLEPGEFRRFVKEIRDAEKLLISCVDKDKLSRELRNMKIVFEKSIVAKTNIPKGVPITIDMIAFKKPGDGIRADRHREVLGKKAKVDINPDTKIEEGMLE